MRYFIALMTVMIVLAVTAPTYGQTQDDEKIAKSLYLKASKAIREEDYQEAVRLLTQILDEYPESEVALDADAKLTEISGKAKLEGLPKTPGFYWVEANGTVSEMATRDLRKGAPYDLGTVWAAFAQEGIPELFADELSRFIVYRPKGNLQDVCWTSFLPLLNVDEKGQQVLSGNNKMFKEWEVESVEGKPFGSSQVVFEEIRPGMWEVGFPSVFSPVNPVLCGLTDGTNQVGLVVVQPKMVHSFYPFLEFWEKRLLDVASNKYIAKQVAKYPDNPDLLFFDAILKYKTAYKQDEPKTEALAIARKAVDLSADHSITPKVVSDLNVLVAYCLADSAVRANTIAVDDPPEVKAQKNSALQAYFSDKLPADLFWIQEQIARNHAWMGEYAEATLVAGRAVDAFKKKKPNTGVSLLGINVKVEVSIGKPGKPEAFSIHDALTCYTLAAEWDRIKDLADEMESERLIAQATQLMASGGDDKAIEKALKDAKGKNKDNVQCYRLMIEYYNRIGKPKDADNAQKDISKAQQRMAERALERTSA